MECTWDSVLLKNLQQLPPELALILQSGNDAEYLDLITKSALDSRYSNIIFANCEPVFAHICARVRRHGSFASSLGVVASVLPLAPYLHAYAEQLLATEKIDGSLFSNADEGLKYLLGLFRLLKIDRRTFSKYVSLPDIVSLLRHQYRPIAYLAVRILQIRLSAADSWFEKMMALYLGPDSPEETIDGPWDDRVIDYRFLTLWEEQRLSELRVHVEGRRQTAPPSSNVFRRIGESSFDSSVALVGSTLLPKYRPASQSARSKADTFVKTAVSTENLNAFALGLRHRHPLLLAGLAGSGKTLLIRHVAQQLGKLDGMVTLHLNEQSDSKLLLGIYSTGESPGSFVWQPGVLTTAVEEGRWLLIEDLDHAPSEIIGSLLPLIEKGELRIPNRKQTIHAAPGFKIIATVRSTVNHRGEENNSLPHLLGARHWHHVRIHLPPASELLEIASQLFPQLGRLLPQFVSVYGRLQTSLRQLNLSGQGQTGVIRPISMRDMLKWCSRVSTLMQERSAVTSFDFDDIFMEAVDCFVGFVPDGAAKLDLASVIAEELRIDPQRRDYLLTEREPQYVVGESSTSVGRYSLARKATRQQASTSSSSFSVDPHTVCMLERVAGAIVNKEPLLLVGETGVGKTSTVQHLARHLGKKLLPFNLSQQSETGDLLGGYKPISVRNVIVPLKDEFDELFEASFSHSKNKSFLDLLSKQMAKSNWKSVCKLWRQALQMVDQQREASEVRPEDEAPKKKRRVETLRVVDFTRWDAFATKVADAEKRVASGSDAFAFKFVEGSLIGAVRNGDWVLLDEINLATSDTLEAIDGLFDTSEPSIFLTEAGGVERIVAHPDFQIFAAMNPATDVGKKDLAPGIRSRFTELYVESPDRDLRSLQSIVRSYLPHEASLDKSVPLEVSTLYQKILELGRQNKLVDGAGHRPHFSLRTLTRTLSYAKYTAPLCTLRRALYEGFHMSFLTFLDNESTNLVQPLLVQHLLGKVSNVRAELQKSLRRPTDGHQYVQGFPGTKHWVRQGHVDLQDQPHYILTPFIRKNMENLVRAASTRQFPVLIQGPTSSGKTSMIEYLAKRTGHQFVRINNHEHTDLQEYLGTYISGSDGRLHFQEGILVKALREGHWIVLDELNLAPTDVLEALNRLLDDNRELVIPETQQVVRPHDNFMLFATQNPAGLYGGRKTLSRAFRNRFLELQFDDIPVEELQEILHRRTQLPESRCKRIVSVYRELSVLREEGRMFEQKSFATLRDLFRWALRSNDTIEDLATNGFLLLAERVRKPEERTAIKALVEKAMSSNGPRVTINEGMYEDQCREIREYKSSNADQSVVWTKAMRRLFILVSRAIQNNEPVLLVGETGCGKTTVCQMLAEVFAKTLHTVNAHQNTETGDIIGSQRPLRNRTVIEADLRRALQQSSILQRDVGTTGSDDVQSTESLLSAYDASVAALESSRRHEYVTSQDHLEVCKLRSRFKSLFEWADGSLVQAMKEGTFFLLDEISLADDSVLERINSVLEPQRSILLAEKGSLDSFVTAAPGFQFFATMNPGGDYGKRELSPALRNRFTEIWVPSLSDAEDITQILTAKLTTSAKPFAGPMLAFAGWFKDRYNTSANSSISIRDALAWVSFVNTFAVRDVIAAITHGAAMVYIDTLGANPAGLMAMASEDIAKDRYECLRKLGELLDADVIAIYSTEIIVDATRDRLAVGPFTIPLRSNNTIDVNTKFSFEALTTRANAMRVMRALQLSKPVLLEGSPGVGKTALVTAIANAAHVPLTRINMSEQTDLIDLFGSDAPIEGAPAGTFAWRDAPFLRAMKAGEWVLLDEMNLASQSVLEGLNACLDHRGEVFVPELGQVFSRHPSFRVFAAQNPHHQGGGRKGLPASFVNRFTVVYADAFKSEDLLLICSQNFPRMDSRTMSNIVRFVDTLEHEVARNPRLGTSGKPWEFNLRDVLKWLSLASSDQALLKSGTTWDFVDFLFAQRFRSTADRLFVRQLFCTVFGDTPLATDLFFSSSPSTMQLGFAMIPRNLEESIPFSSTWTPKSAEQLRTLQYIMLSIQQRWPIILTGTTGVGKTALIERLAYNVGASLETISLNAETDIMDLIGGYEQTDPHRSSSQSVRDFRSSITSLCRSELLESSNLSEIQEIVSFENDWPDLDLLYGALRGATESVTSRARAHLSGVIQLPHAVNKAQFEWTDGILVEALLQGRWLVLDNANLASSSVLDRLNSLLEPDGTLIINEHGSQDGSPRVISPHPNFRIFLTVDPRYGELSRAMRNRGVELYLSGGDAEAEQTICGDPLLTESAIFRFRQMNALSKTDPSSSYHMVSIMQDHYSVSDCAIVSRFSRQLQQGLYSIEGGFTEAQTLPWSLVDGLSGLQNFYDNIMHSKHLPAEAASSQTLHPLNNQALVQLSPSTFATSSILAFILDTEVTMFSMRQIFTSITSDNKVTSSLKRLERSLQLATSPTGGLVLSILEGLFDAILLVLRRGTGISIHNLTYLKRSMDELCAFWVLFAESAQHGTLDIANIAALVSLGRRLIDNPALSEVLLADGVASDATRMLLQLDSTFSARKAPACTELWKALKPPVPSTAALLNNLVEFEVTTARFDQVCQSFELPMEIMIELRQNFSRSLALASKGIDGIAQLTAKVEDLLQIRSTQQQRRPHFLQIFQSLQERFALLALDAPALSNNEAISLAILAGVNTKEASESNEESVKDIRVYLRRLSVSTWRLRNNNYGDSLNDDLQTVIHQALDSVGSVSLENLDLLTTETKHLGRLIASHADALGVSVAGSVDSSLRRMLLGVLTLLSTHSNVDLQQFGLTYAKKLLGTDAMSETLAGTIKASTTLNRPSSRSHSAILSHFETAVSYCLGLREKNLANASHAWISFAVGCLQLYVGDLPFDPSSESRLRWQIYVARNGDLESRLDSLRRFRTRLMGEGESLRARMFQDEIAALGPEPIVEDAYRPQPFRLDSLQGDFASLMRLVAQLRGQFTPLDSTLSFNLLRVREKLSTAYREYRDLVAPVIFFIDVLLMGYRLAIQSQFDEMPLPERASLDSIVPFVEGSICTWNMDQKLVDASHCAVSLEERMFWLHLVACRSAHLPLTHTSLGLQDVVNAQFAQVFWQWKSELTEEQKKDANKSSLFKYKGSEDMDDITEADVTELFPESLDDRSSPDESSQMKRAQQAASAVARNHYAIFVAQEESRESLLGLLEEWAHLPGHRETSRSSTVNIPVIVTTLQGIGTEFEKSSSTATPSNIYTDVNAVEVKKLSELVKKVKVRCSELHAAWPEHATPVEAIRLCEHLQSTAYSAPLTQFFPLLEKLHGTMNEWQKVASGEYSVQALIDGILNLIVEWRQLELSSWAGLYDREWDQCQQNAASWWYVAYESIVAASTDLSGHDDISIHIANLLKTLSTFLQSSGIGEFSARLRMLRGFENHLKVLKGSDGQLQRVQFALSNFVAYFESFEANITDELVKGRAALEKEIKVVIQLASWKDRNVEVLRQSAQSSHRKLLRLVRKYRNLLAKSAYPILSAPIVEKRVHVVRLDHMAGAALPHSTHLMSSPIVAWINRPERFHDIQKTARLVTSKARTMYGLLAGSLRLQAFSDDLTQSVVELQKSTPTTLTDDNKTLVNHLKTRKRRLLAEVLKDLRIMGFQNAVSQVVIGQQSSFEAVLARMPSLDRCNSTDGQATAQYEFNRYLSILAVVRDCARGHSDDLTAAEVARCVGLQESILHETCRQRKALAAHMRQLEMLQRVVKQIQNLETCTDMATGNSVHNERELHLVNPLRTILRMAVHFLHAQSSLAGLDYSELVRDLEAKSAEVEQLQTEMTLLPQLPPGLTSQDHLSWQDKCEDLYKRIEHSVDDARWKYPETLPILSHLIKWTVPQESPDGPRTNGVTGLSPESWVQQVLNVMDTILGALQDLEKISRIAASDDGDKNWIVSQRHLLDRAMKALHVDLITSKLQNLLSSLHNVGDQSSVRHLATIYGALYPVVDAYVSAITSLASKNCELHIATCKAAYKLGNIFIQLAKNGFCTPPDKSQNNEQKAGNVESGTGLGDGEGAEDISKDIEDDEDLSELAQEMRAEKSEENGIEHEKDAVDMADDDLEGAISDASAEGDDDDDVDSDGEEKQQDLDEELGKVDASAPSAVDEKTWSGEQDEGQDDLDESQKKGEQQGNDMAAGDDKNAPESDSKSGEDGETHDMPEDEHESIKQGMEDQIESTAQEQENLDLPEDINMEGGEPGAEEASDLDSLPDDQLTADDFVDDEDGTQDVDSQSLSSHEGEDASDMDLSGEAAEAAEAAEDPDAADNNDAQSDIMMQDSQDDVQNRPQDIVSGESGSGPDKVEGQGQGLEALNEDHDDAAEEDGGDKGGPSTTGTQEQTARENSNKDSSGDASHERGLPYKQLGDLLNEWYNQHRHIEDAKDEDDTGAPDQSQDLANARFEHLRDGDKAMDTQALGAAPINQSTALNEENALSVNEDEQNDPPFNELPDPDKDEQDARSQTEDHRIHHDATAHLEKNAETLVGQPSNVAKEDYILDDASMTPVDEFDDVDEQLTNTHISHGANAAEISLEEARQQWAEHEANTRNLSLMLTEHLRLILQPTQATKMRGDFRTGKRLNIKRIIPYIASSFKRDKIWMRRSVPSKRAYQIMLAIDDSESMSENESRQLAFDTLALVSKSLSMLEVGELSVVGFGEDVNVVHDFNTIFSPETGAQVLQKFMFAQRKTNVRQLLAESIQMFRAARLKTSGSTRDLWQLQVIISDGMCEDHPSVRQLVRQAHEERIMIVFIVVDAAAQQTQVASNTGPQSILDLQTAEFVKGTDGEMQLKMVKYLDTFPFRYYLIVRDVKELPGVLAGALRQWFAEVVGTEP